MAGLVRKKINTKEYTYFSKSIRLPNGKVATITKKLPETDVNMKKQKLEKKYKDYFIAEEKRLFGDWAVKNHRESHIFPASEIRKIEEMRVGYKHLMKQLDKNSLTDVLNRFTANFIYDSDAIEGSSLTLKDVSMVIFEDTNISGKPLREIFEARNSRKVVELIFKKRFSVTEKDIIKMHRTLMKDIDQRTGYKKVPNVILHHKGEIHTTPPEMVAKGMGNLIKWFESTENMHPLEKAAVFHGKFENIHPFQDGNGRVGRFLINIILIRSGYPPLIIRKTTREAYMSSLDDFDTGYEDKLKRFLLERFTDTYKKFFEMYVQYL